MSLDNLQVRFERLRCIGRLDYRQRGLLREVLQRFDSSEKSRFCSKTALPKCLTINDWLFCKIAKSERFFGKIEKLQLPLEHADLLLATKDHLGASFQVIEAEMTMDEVANRLYPCPSSGSGAEGLPCEVKQLAVDFTVTARQEKR